MTINVDQQLEELQGGEDAEPEVDNVEKLQFSNTLLIDIQMNR